MAMAMASALAFRVGAPPCSSPASPIDLRRLIPARNAGCSALATPSGSFHVKTTTSPVHYRRAPAITTCATGDVLAVEGTADPQPASGAEGIPPAEQPAAGPEGTPASQPLDPIAALKLESDILKKRKKRLELRRKRLKRKRRLRKKGRWPPSKVAKNKNI